MTSATTASRSRPANRFPPSRTGPWATGLRRGDLQRGVKRLCRTFRTRRARTLKARSAPVSFSTGATAPSSLGADSALLFRRIWRADFLGGDEQIYGWDLEASQYFHLPGDLILLINGEAATVDVWNQPETNTTGRKAIGPVAPHGLQVGPSDPRGADLRPSLSLVAPIICVVLIFAMSAQRTKRASQSAAKSLARATVEIDFSAGGKNTRRILLRIGFVNPEA